jgi:hypothetical protein
MNMPGDNIINNCRIGSTRGIDILGKPEEIWQEVIQLKKKRPDIYNYNWIENLLNYKFIKKTNTCDFYKEGFLITGSLFLSLAKLPKYMLSSRIDI